MTTIYEDFITMLKIWLLGWVIVAGLIVGLAINRPPIIDTDDGDVGKDSFTDWAVGCIDDCLDPMDPMED